ncbi:MAG: DUF2147 domain-containing protein [Gammaproteobacteria bacterium]|nr:DUF2147 domain-containing protein [Gammaproteobacteria bacterium]
MVGGEAALAEEAPSPIGNWITIDDKTGQQKSIVEIKEENGQLVGVVKTLLLEPGKLCTACEGDLKGKPIEGMKILWDFKASKEPGKWTDGRILDPKNGKVYTSYLTLFGSETPQKLKVRGYIGISLLGRTQIWQRAKLEEPKPIL